MAVVCENVSTIDADELLSINCQNHLLGQAIVDILTYLCENCFEEIVCTASGSTIDDSNWQTITGCEPECGDIQVLLNVDGTINELYVRNNNGVWEPFSGNLEYRTGLAGNFVDDQNPTNAELLALFGGNISDHALVGIRSTGAFYETNDSGLNWFSQSGTVRVAIQDVANQTNLIINGQTPVSTTVASGIIYSSGTATSGDTPLTVSIGDEVDVRGLLQYYIDQYAFATNPVDSVTMQIVLTGAVNKTIGCGNLRDNADVYIGKNFIATGNGTINYSFNITATGTATTNPAIDWRWIFSHRHLQATIRTR
jgi:hypothetical protein